MIVFLWVLLRRRIGVTGEFTIRYTHLYNELWVKSLKFEDPVAIVNK